MPPSPRRHHPSQHSSGAASANRIRPSQFDSSSLQQRANTITATDHHNRSPSLAQQLAGLEGFNDYTSSKWSTNVNVAASPTTSARMKSNSTSIVPPLTLSLASTTSDNPRPSSSHRLPSRSRSRSPHALTPGQRQIQRNWLKNVGRVDNFEGPEEKEAQEDFARMTDEFEVNYSPMDGDASGPIRSPTSYIPSLTSARPGAHTHPSLHTTRFDFDEISPAVEGVSFQMRPPSATASSAGRAVSRSERMAVAAVAAAATSSGQSRPGSAEIRNIISSAPAAAAASLGASHSRPATAGRRTSSVTPITSNPYTSTTPSFSRPTVSSSSHTRDLILQATRAGRTIEIETLSSSAHTTPANSRPNSGVMGGVRSSVGGAGIGGTYASRLFIRDEDDEDAEDNEWLDGDASAPSNRRRKSYSSYSSSSSRPQSSLRSRPASSSTTSPFTAASFRPQSGSTLRTRITSSTTTTPIQSSYDPSLIRRIPQDDLKRLAQMGGLKGALGEKKGGKKKNGENNRSANDNSTTAMTRVAKVPFLARSGSQAHSTLPLLSSSSTLSSSSNTGFTSELLVAHNLFSLFLRHAQEEKKAFLSENLFWIYKLTEVLRATEQEKVESTNELQQQHQQQEGKRPLQQQQKKKDRMRRDTTDDEEEKEQQEQQQQQDEQKQQKMIAARLKNDSSSSSQPASSNSSSSPNIYRTLCVSAILKEVLPGLLAQIGTSSKISADSTTSPSTPSTTTSPSSARLLLSTGLNILHRSIYQPSDALIPIPMSEFDLELKKKMMVGGMIQQKEQQQQKEKNKTMPSSSTAMDLNTNDFAMKLAGEKLFSTMTNQDDLLLNHDLSSPSSTIPSASASAITHSIPYFLSTKYLYETNSLLLTSSSAIDTKIQKIDSRITQIYKKYDQRVITVMFQMWRQYTQQQAQSYQLHHILHRNSLQKQTISDPFIIFHMWKFYAEKCKIKRKYREQMKQMQVQIKSVSTQLMRAGKRDNEKLSDYLQRIQSSFHALENESRYSSVPTDIFTPTVWKLMCRQWKGELDVIEGEFLKETDVDGDEDVSGAQNQQQKQLQQQPIAPNLFSLCADSSPGTMHDYSYEVDLVLNELYQLNEVPVVVNEEEQEERPGVLSRATSLTPAISSNNPFLSLHSTSTSSTSDEIRSHLHTKLVALQVQERDTEEGWMEILMQMTLEEVLGKWMNRHVGKGWSMMNPNSSASSATAGTSSSHKHSSTHNNTNSDHPPPLITDFTLLITQPELWLLLLRSVAPETVEDVIHKGFHELRDVGKGGVGGAGGGEKHNPYNLSSSSYATSSSSNHYQHLPSRSSTDQDTYKILLARCVLQICHQLSCLPVITLEQFLSHPSHGSIMSRLAGERRMRMMQQGNQGGPTAGGKRNPVGAGNDLAGSNGLAWIYPSDTNDGGNTHGGMRKQHMFDDLTHDSGMVGNSMMAQHTRSPSSKGKHAVANHFQQQQHHSSHHHDSSIQANPHLHLCLLAALFLQRPELPSTESSSSATSTAVSLNPASSSSSSSASSPSTWIATTRKRLTDIQHEYDYIQTNKSTPSAAPASRLQLFHARITHMTLEFDWMRERVQRRQRGFMNLRKKMEELIWTSQKRVLNGQQGTNANQNRDTAMNTLTSSSNPTASQAIAVYTSIPISHILSLLSSSTDATSTQAMRDYQSIQVILGKHYEELNNIWRHYVSLCGWEEDINAGTQSNSTAAANNNSASTSNDAITSDNLLTFPSFILLLVDCHLLSKRFSRGLYHMIYEESTISTNEHEKRMEKMNQHLMKQQSEDLYEHLEASRGGGGSAKGDGDNNNSSTASHTPRSSDPLRKCTQAQLFEAFIRISILKYSQVTSIPERLRRLIEIDILPYAHRLKLDEFRALLNRDRVRYIFRTHAVELQTIFQYYAKEDSSGVTSSNHHNSNHSNNNNHTSSLIRNRVMTRDGFLRLAHEARMFSTASNLHGGGAGGGSSGSDVSISSVAGHLPFYEHNLTSIFSSVLRLPPSRLASFEMSYPEYLETLSAISVFISPDPYLPIQVKIENFINSKLVTMVAHQTARGVRKVNAQQHPNTVSHAPHHHAASTTSSALLSPPSKSLHVVLTPPPQARNL